MSYNPILVPSLERFRSSYEVEIAGKLTAMAKDHEGSSDGFTALPLDPDNPIHRIDCIGTSGQNADTDALLFVAKTVYPDGHEQLFDTFASNEAMKEDIDRTLQSGKSFTALTDHPAVLGTPFTGGALAYTLYEELDYTPDDFDILLISNAMIKHVTAFDIMDGGSIIAGLFNEVRYTLPSSNSIKQAKMPELPKNQFNQKSVESCFEVLGSDKPTIVLMAGSGQRDKFTPRKFGSFKRNHRVPAYHMRPPAYGTLDILRQTRVLPIGLDISKDDKPFIHIGKMSPAVNDMDDFHLIMHQLARGINADYPRMQPKRIYHETRESFDEAVKFLK